MTAFHSDLITSALESMGLNSALLCGRELAVTKQSVD